VLDKLSGTARFLMNLKIVKAAETDVSQIIELLREFAEFENLSEYCETTEDKLRDAMFGAKAFVEGLVAFDGETPIGYAIFYPNFASFRGQRGVYLEDIFIKPDYRGKGIGEAMLKEIARSGARSGAVRMDFQVLDWNESAIKFYEKLGGEMDASERHFKFTDEAFLNLTR
jgi:ribosomal protein S18 acetylase RimI-like enzyme